MDSGRIRRMAGLVGERRFLAILLSASAVFALLVALVSSEPIHRLWGAWACAGYAAAALILLAGKSARLTVVAATASLAGAVLGPLVQLAAQGRDMPEVSVIEQAAALLLHHGTPYALAAQQAGPGFLRYDPYLPVMTIFGLPHALAGPGVLTDPRLRAPLSPAWPRWPCGCSGPGRRAWRESFSWPRRCLRSRSRSAVTTFLSSACSASGWPWRRPHCQPRPRGTRDQSSLVSLSAWRQP